MWFLILQIYITLILSFAEQEALSPTYLVAAPSVVRLGVPTSLSVTIFTHQPVSVTAALRHGNTTLAQTRRTVRHGVTELLTLQSVSAVAAGRVQICTLVVRGRRGDSLLFANSTALPIRRWSISTFIHTDKPRYRPGQTVRVRVLSVWPDGNHCGGPVDVFIRNPERDVANQWMSLDSVNGAVWREFQLPHDASQGLWLVEARVNGKQSSKQFSVGHHELPNVEISVEVPVEVLQGQEISGTEAAQCTSGRSVHGKLTVIATGRRHSTLCLSVNHTHELQGFAEFRFNENDLARLKLMGSGSPPQDKDERTHFSITVSLTEPWTGTHNDKIMSLSVALNTHHFVNHCHVWKTSFNFSQLNIPRFDNSSVISVDGMDDVLIKVTQLSEDDAQREAGPLTYDPPAQEHNSSAPDTLTQTLSLPLPEDGVLHVPLRLHDRKAGLLIQATLTSANRSPVVQRTHTSHDGPHLQIRSGLPAQVGIPIQFEIESTCAFTNQHYVVMSGGRLLDTGKVTGTSLSLLPAKSWFPEACVTLLGILPGGEILSDATSVPLTKYWRSPSSVQRCKLLFLTDAKSPQMEHAKIVGSMQTNRVTREGRPWESKPKKKREVSEISVSETFRGQRGLSLSLNLPSCLIRGEELVVEVNLLNNQQEEIKVLVVLGYNDSFEFVLRNKGANSQTVVVAGQNTAKILFPIRPLTLGVISVMVNAISLAGSDAIIRTFLVKSEGVEQSISRTLFLELAPTEVNLTERVLLSFPAGVVLGSKTAHVAVIGDILGPSITPLRPLTGLPSGCGEQNMIRFAPNVYLLQYLSTRTYVNQDLLDKALASMREGYKQELFYLREDGSFSAFGTTDPSGSTWLTAFVLRCFLQAQAFIDVEQEVISRATAWLLRQQAPQGSFMEPGRVIHPQLQGGLDGTVSLTAYVLIALLEDSSHAGMFQDSVSKAEQFLADSLARGLPSNYSLCLVAYALSLANSPDTHTALSELRKVADRKDGVMFWTSGDDDLADSWQPPSASVEMAAYMLLLLFRQVNIEEGIGLMKWLSSQRNHLGGFGSTQDTVVALEALSKFAAFSGSDSIDVNIEVTTLGSNQVSAFAINSFNYLEHQRQDIDVPQNVSIEIFMEGRGFALFQVNMFYNVEASVSSRCQTENTTNETFALNVVVFDDQNDHNHLKLFICSRLLENRNINQTGMVLMEVDALSGFKLTEPDLATDTLIQKVEILHRKAVFYLASLTTAEECINVTLVREQQIARQQPALVQVYDYYEPRRRTVRPYHSAVMRNLSSESFCGDEWHFCGGMTWTSDSTPTHSTSTHFLYRAQFLLLIIFVIS